MIDPQWWEPLIILQYSHPAEWFSIINGRTVNVLLRLSTTYRMSEKEAANSKTSHVICSSYGY